MPKLFNPFCVTVVGARFFSKEQEEQEGEEQELHRYAVVSVGGYKKQTDHQPGGLLGVEWGDVLQFDKSKIPADAQIVVQVYNKWKLSSELVGEIQVPYERYKDVSVQYALLHWYPMKLDRPSDPTLKGELGLIMGFYEGNSDALQGKKFLSADDPAYETMNADDIMVEAVKVARENNQRVQRIANLTEQTKNLGVQNVENLAQQMETTKQVEQDLDQINDDIIIAEEKVKNMESCWTMFCGRKKAKKAVAKKASIREKAKARAEEERMRVEAQREKQAMKEARVVPQPAGAALSDLLETKSDLPPDPRTSGLKGELKREVTQIDQGLDRVHDNVKDLKAIATDLRDKLDEDLTRLQNVDNLATKDLAHITRVNDRTRRLV